VRLDLSLHDAVDAFTRRPAAISGLSGRGHGGPIVPGRPANLTVLDLEERWRVDCCRLASGGVNNPYVGSTLIGRVRHTLVRGNFTVRDSEPQWYAGRIDASANSAGDAWRRSAGSRALVTGAVA